MMTQSQINMIENAAKLMVSAMAATGMTYEQAVERVCVDLRDIVARALANSK